MEQTEFSIESKKHAPIFFFLFLLFSLPKWHSCGVSLMIDDRLESMLLPYFSRAVLMCLLLSLSQSPNCGERRTNERASERANGVTKVPHQGRRCGMTEKVPVI
ncbi:uncharacterized protein BYT42DRAFT_44765 [Radiomyces spectabilis]|uniref:uncharacterized protein n=1 Tax=Radiomyces spectabilis TaxID=64574 RepID=UPI00221FE5B7|nr:uncharacterized protein BYT42DRAFT_44765 [Radiomyces spectabilis]KAI8372760.1 hypothetical protein BYT42DRAFT_44765 [Radiomyces spectabilis]